VSELRPLPDDPAAAEIVSMFDLGDDNWLVTIAGEYQTAAGEAMKRDGSNWQEVVMVEWPCRTNRRDDAHTLRLMISPEDAIGLAEVLARTANWMMSRRS
jgi:hypothetical protein